MLQALISQYILELYKIRSYIYLWLAGLSQIFFVWNVAFIRQCCEAMINGQGGHTHQVVIRKDAALNAPSPSSLCDIQRMIPILVWYMQFERTRESCVHLYALYYVRYFLF